MTSRITAMGNRNVRRVLTCTPPITDVPPQAKMCLALMALLAHDDDPRYWGGIEWLEINLGYVVGPTGRATVMRHIAILKAAGYVRTTPKRMGKRVVYELHLPQMIG